MSHITKYFLPYIGIPALISGILLYHSVLLGIFSTILLVLCTIYLLYVYDLSHFIHAFFLLSVWICIGLLSSWYEMYQFNSFYTKIEQKRIDILGTVVDYQHYTHMRNNHRITLSLTHYILTDKQYPLSGLIYVYIKDSSSQQLYTIGSILCINKIQIQRPNQSFLQYLIKEGIYGTLFTSQDTIIQTKTSRPWYTYIHMLRTSIFTRIQDKLSPHHFALFSSLFLGNKFYNKTDIEPIQDHFRRWGIAHIFARSGMHISIIISILISILLFIPITHHIKIVFITSIGMIYTLCSWSSISFMRSFIMFIFGNYGMAHKRYINPLYLLTITTMLVLILHPLHLFFLDFQLSFLLTGALIWICKNISDLK